MSSPRSSVFADLTPDGAPRCPSHPEQPATGSCPRCRQAQCGCCGGACGACEAREALAVTVRRRAARAMRFLLASGLLSGSFAVVTRFGLGPSSEEDARLVAEAAYWVSWLLWLATAVAFLRWLHGLMRLAPLLDAPPSRRGFSPRAAIVWWFVPIANLWLPYQAVRELYYRLAGLEEGGARAPAHAILRLWWGCWFLGGLLTHLPSSYVLGELLTVAAAYACVRVLRVLQSHAEDRLVGFGAP